MKNTIKTIAICASLTFSSMAGDAYALSPGDDVRSCTIAHSSFSSKQISSRPVMSSYYIGLITTVQACGRRGCRTEYLTGQYSGSVMGPPPSKTVIFNQQRNNIRNSVERSIMNIVTGAQRFQCAMRL